MHHLEDGVSDAFVGAEQNLRDLFPGKIVDRSIANVDSPSELRELLGLPILTNFRIESHTLESFEQMTAFFKKHESETEM